VLCGVASTAVAKAAVVHSGEVGRSAVYSRYNNGPSTVLSTVQYSVSAFTRKCLLCKYDFRARK
jgi:hypothetical protein